MTSWRPRGSEIGSSNGRFQPVGVLREAMRALLRDVRNVDQVFLEAVTVEDIAARAFQIDAACFPGSHSFGGSRFPASHKAYFLAVQSL